MTKTKNKKIGYKEYERLLALAHQKTDILAQRLQALQSYITSYVEFRKDNTKFNDWITQNIIKEQEKVKQEQVNEEV